MNEPTSGAQLLEKLQEVRKSWADGPPEALREALGKALEEELRGRSDEDRDRELQALEETLVARARRRQERIDELEEQVRSLTREKESLSRENARLTADAGSSPSPAASGGDGEALDRLHESLRRMLEGERVTQEDLRLPPERVSLFKLIQELIRFAARFENAVLNLQKQLEVGPAGEMGTVVFQKFQENLTRLLRDCLEDKPGATAALKELLDRNSQFLIFLNKSHESATLAGFRSILTELDPEPILEKTKGGMLKRGNYEQAWKDYGTRHGDLLNLPPSEIYERFCLDEFKKQLTRHLKATGGDS
jgi:hypothetical protein